MSEADAVLELLARIDRTQRLLRRIVDEYRTFLEGDFKLLGRKNTSAIVIAEMMVDYYTCTETVFLRASQFFGNHLDNDRCHADLLDRMTLRIEGVRDPVISDDTAGWLGELMKFRHFRRYYFELDYDWDKLDYLQTVFGKVVQRLPSDLQSFASFLRQLA
jgi:ribonuclease HepT-like protein